MNGNIKILGHTVPLVKEHAGGTTPHAYLKNWSMSDKDPKVHTLEDLNMRMQNRWPGKYKIVTETKWNGHNYYINEYVFKFDSPQDETFFKIKYA